MQLISPHGNQLVNCYTTNNNDSDYTKLLSWDLTQRQLCDLELILNGAFSPLKGFMTKKEYESCLQDTRLPDNNLWPIPITLDVTESFAGQLNINDQIALRDPEGVLIAILNVENIWAPNFKEEAQAIYGTEDIAHPSINFLFNRSNPIYIGGKLTGIEPPSHYDYLSLRHTPAELRKYFSDMGWSKIIAFQTRNPMHRAHVELTLRAAKQTQANLLIHPVVGLTKPGDIDHITRVKCYQAAQKKLPTQTTKLSLLPLAMRMAGPREALWHAIIRKNYCCTHFIVGRDHAGPGKDSNGNDFYGPYDAQQIMLKHQDELEIEMVPFKKMVYLPHKSQYEPADSIDKNEQTLDLSGTELRRRLREGVEIPEWFSFPEVVEQLRKNYPPKNQQGFTLFFTGLSGAGKSTIAKALLAMLMEQDDRPVTLLDGDIVRKHLSSELGFSKEHRNLNVERIGFVASEITKNRGIAICAPIAPYQDTRRKVREMIEQVGEFVEIYVSTPIETCEKRDRKGLYAKARAGIIKEFTGINDPYETPEKAEIEIDTSKCSVLEAAQQVILKLEQIGLIGQ